jgi:hypothetical protein
MRPPHEIRLSTPFNRSARLLCVAMFFIAAIGLLSYKTHGFASLRSAYEQFAWDYERNAQCTAKTRTKQTFCMQLGNPNRITLGILGDSTGNSLVPGIAEAMKGDGIINIGQGSCPPLRGMLPTPNNPDCPAIVDDAYRVMLAEKNVKTVILALFTNDLTSLAIKDLPANAPLETRMNTLMAMLDADIKALGAAGKKVILTYDTPLSPLSAKDCADRPILHWLGISMDCTIKESAIINRHPQIDMLDKHYLGRNDVCVFHQSPILFTNGYLNFKDAQGKLLIRDYHHLSVYGSKKMAQLLENSNCKGALPWQ